VDIAEETLSPAPIEGKDVILSKKQKKNKIIFGG
jgi:hypothetical protein